ncbi:hypothetical protein AURDEDRAFT_157793 [Auricularia subglabra TFB-10046 SS5]|nr:hypothetical protein AURDEDRAFT_157793 [Auricularia subglabra TFB-10046 SS5]
MPFTKLVARLPTVPNAPYNLRADAGGGQLKVLGFTIGGDHGYMASVYIGEKAEVNIHLVQASTMRFARGQGEGEAQFTPHEVLIMVDHPTDLNEVDEVAKTLEGKGVEFFERVETKPWGYRQFTIRDADGHFLVYFQHGSNEETE